MTHEPDHGASAGFGGLPRTRVQRRGTPPGSAGPAGPEALSPGADFLGQGRPHSRLVARDFLDLLSREGIPLYDPAEEELAEEWKTAQRFGVGQ